MLPTQSPLAGAEALAARGTKALVRGPVAVAAGPVGRSAQASTDEQLKAEIYSYSRARGLFAGVALDGTVLRMDLDANYSTGAEWQRRDAFGAVLESVPCEGIVREPLVKAGEPAPPVGTGSTARYCFRAAKPGRAFLYLFYGRAWQPEATPQDSFTLHVTVTPAD